MRIHNYITLMGLLLTLSCIRPEASQTQSEKTISIMTFNVENLFDTEHEKGKTDFTFLPLSSKNTPEVKKYCGNLGNPKWKDECKYLDWSELVLKQKMKNLTASVLQVEKGNGPDILILQEVENIDVLKRWIREQLDKSKYQTIELLEGWDERGIDVAIVSRLPKIGEAVLHKIPFQNISDKDEMDTRGILEVTLKLPNGEPLTVYAAHFPAPYHKKEYRFQAIEFLNSLMKQKPAGVLQIAGGDFNTPIKEDRKFEVLNTKVAPSWIVAHREGYTGTQGSSYYPKDKTWSFLDMILISKSFADQKGWEWNPKSFLIADQYRAQVDDQGIPISFDPRTGLGVSDHLPLYLEIEKR